jgi:hypothetical protein
MYFMRSIDTLYISNSQRIKLRTVPFSFDVPTRITYIYALRGPYPYIYTLHIQYTHQAHVLSVSTENYCSYLPNQHMRWCNVCLHHRTSYFIAVCKILPDKILKGRVRMILAILKHFMGFPDGIIPNHTGRVIE